MFAVIWPLNLLVLFAVGVWFTRVADDAAAWRATGVLGASVVAALGWAWLLATSLTGCRRRRCAWPLPPS